MTGPRRPAEAGPTPANACWRGLEPAALRFVARHLVGESSTS